MRRRIATSDAYVYAMTKASISSEWCQWEFATAVNLKSPAIPVLFESSLAIPEPLRSLQYADFREGATGIAVARLMGALNSLQKVASE